MDLLSPEMAEQIFNECDIRRKGALTMDDFRNLSQLTEGEFTDEETEFIFEQLDVNKDGVVTKEEFVNGFAKALNVGETKGFSDMKRRGSLIPPSLCVSLASSPVCPPIEEIDSGPPKAISHFENESRKLDVLPCQEEVLALYGRLQCLTKPERLKNVSINELLGQFEKVIDAVAKELIEQRDQNERLRDLLAKEKTRHDQQIDEVETNLTMTLVEAKERAKREERERFEREKEAICQQFETELTELKTTISTLQKSVFDDENEKYEKSEEIRQRLKDMMKENVRLRHDLAAKETEFVLVNAAISRLRQNYDEKLSDWTTEKEQLIRYSENMNNQLQMLYEANKQLQDTNDHLRSIVEAKIATSRQPSMRTPSPVPYGGNVSPVNNSKQTAPNEIHSGGSNFLHVRRPVSVWLRGPEDSMETDEDLDSGLFTRGSNTTCSADSAAEDERRLALARPWDSGLSDKEEPTCGTIIPRAPVDCSDLRTDSFSSSNARVGGTSHSRSGGKMQQGIEPTGPTERTFRVVMVGDASVGKTSLMMRMVKGQFHEHVSATIGIEYQSKCLRVDQRNVALQLWDTAGQEKFRSLVDTYFRRADGAILVYDATCEQSFLNVRFWLDKLQDNVNRKIPVLLCANKIDLRIAAAAKGQRCISAQDGEELAKRHSTLFVETSAKDGTNVVDAMLQLTRDLLVAEDSAVHSACVVLEQKKKSGCRSCKSS